MSPETQGVDPVFHSRQSSSAQSLDQTLSRPLLGVWTEETPAPRRDSNRTRVASPRLKEVQDHFVGIDQDLQPRSPTWKTQTDFQ